MDPTLRAREQTPESGKQTSLFACQEIVQNASNCRKTFDYSFFGGVGGPQTLLLEPNQERV